MFHKGKFHYRGRIFRGIRKVFKFNQKYRVGSYTLTLPYDHLLPLYRRKYPSYDLFLPHLATYLQPETLVVDVGANVGDTTLAMYFASPNLKFVSIEPDLKFFNYLISNLRQIPEDSFSAHQLAISSALGSYRLESRSGTASIEAVTYNTNNQASTLDSLINALHPPFQGKNISLVKTDTDGHDAYVLMSGLVSIKEHQPFLFIECLINESTEIGTFTRLFSKLTDLNYRKCWIFSNTGQLLGEETSFDRLTSLLEENYKRSKESGYGQYVDLFFATTNNLGLASKCINSYQLTLKN
jgi:FkbM family methyltransferase